MVRDLPFLHLPLRQAFASLLAAGAGLPDWNPFIHGGQPDPLEPALRSLVPGNLARACPARCTRRSTSPSWRTPRSPSPAPGACCDSSAPPCGAAPSPPSPSPGGGFFVALTNTLLVFTGWRGLPWILAGFDRWLGLTPPPGRARGRSLAAAVPLGLQVLNGDPTCVVVTGVFVALLGADAARGSERGATAARLGEPRSSSASRSARCSSCRPGSGCSIRAAARACPSRRRRSGRRDRRASSMRRSRRSTARRRATRRTSTSAGR